MRAFATAPAAPLQHSDVQSSLDCWQQRRYDQHLPAPFRARGPQVHKFLLYKVKKLSALLVTFGSNNLLH